MTDETAAERQRRRRDNLRKGGLVGFRFHMTVAQRTELQVAAAVEEKTMEDVVLHRVFGDKE